MIINPYIATIVGGPPDPPPVTPLFAMTLEGTSASANTIYTFAQGFKKGDVPAAQTLLFRSAGSVDLRTQIDRKSSYDDGSLEHGLIAIELPLIADAATLAIELFTGVTHPTPGSTIDLAAALVGRTAVVGVDPEGAGAEWTYDLVANIPATRWRTGPLVSECRVEVVIPADKMGSAAASPASDSTCGRLVADLWLTKDGQLFVNAMIANDSVAWPESTGKLAKCAGRLTIDGVNVATFTERNIALYSRAWLFGGRRSAVLTATWYPAWQRPACAYLASAGWGLPYDTTNLPSEATLAAYATAYGRATWNDGYPNTGFTDSRDLTVYVPGTGDRGEIGFHTQAGSAWITAGQSVKRAERYACDQAEFLQSMPVFAWDKTNARWLDKVTRNLWMDFRHTDFVPQHGQNSVWTTDVSHYPCAPFAPYLLRGRRADLDLVEASASFAIANSYHNAVDGLANYTTNTGIRLFVNLDQRAVAWMTRNTIFAMRFAPSSGANGAYWRNVINSNFDWINTENANTYVTTEGSSYLHEWWNTSGGAVAPWQNAYIMQSLWAVAKRGEHPKALTLLLDLNGFYSNLIAQTTNGFPDNVMGYYVYNRVGPGYTVLHSDLATLVAAQPPPGYGYNGDPVYDILARLRCELVRDIAPSNTVNNTARTTLAATNKTGFGAAYRATYPKANVLAT